MRAELAFNAGERGQNDLGRHCGWLVFFCPLTPTLSPTLNASGTRVQRGGEGAKRVGGDTAVGWFSFAPSPPGLSKWSFDYLGGEGWGEGAVVTLNPWGPPKRHDAFASLRLF
ncbi:hypothetical protein K227x_52230 [Rubripirellula lacrimiformis]|uniref:Uncharacterized protein n=1 Tax=Rubripirellula lacrimiformis TaxID=1930273 RepID=A0A517NI41_9BACT|nr:hypothetical protein K227x_52230 [Rubripirellula lacrimiformis]